MSLTTKANSKGFTLIEVLIALIVLAIGLLGMATLMMASLQSSQGAAQRSAATVVAYDLIERMRVNRNEAIKASSDYVSDPSTADSDCDPEAGCSAEEMVVYDLETWWTALQAAIPGAEVTIQQDPAGAGDDAYCIVIFWQEPGVVATDSADAAPCGEDPEGRAFYSLQVVL